MIRAYIDVISVGILWICWSYRHILQYYSTPNQKKIKLLNTIISVYFVGLFFGKKETFAEAISAHFFTIHITSFYSEDTTGAVPLVTTIISTLNLPINHWHLPPPSRGQEDFSGQILSLSYPPSLSSVGSQWLFA